MKYEHTVVDHCSEDSHAIINSLNKLTGEGWEHYSTVAFAKMPGGMSMQAWTMLLFRKPVEVEAVVAKADPGLLVRVDAGPAEVEKQLTAREKLSLKRSEAAKKAAATRRSKKELNKWADGVVGHVLKKRGIKK